MSKKTRTSVSTLCALNNMSKSSVLRIGKKLRIKAGK
ncbi:MAG: LysM peptidoglycan-binding domain-containing protein [Bacteroidales bacterium]|nr:LysM peptidoglycan-binding domain-containing protein [Bacteroidales bacterium]